MKHVNTFENFLGEAKVLKKNDTTYGWHMAIIESDIFGKIKLETKIVPTEKGNHEPVEGSVTAVVKMGIGNSPSETIKEYTIGEARHIRDWSFDVRRFPLCAHETLLTLKLIEICLVPSLEWTTKPWLYASLTEN